MEVLPYDLIEEILKKLAPKSLIRFKSVSKQWKSTIESRVFQQNHLTYHRQKSKNPNHVLLISNDYTINLQTLETLELESSISHCKGYEFGFQTGKTQIHILYTHNIPNPWKNNVFILCRNSIDGLVCFYNYDSTIIFNPATRWYRTLPPSTFQRQSFSEFSTFGFGKDEITGLYKPVWLFNSLELGQNTICEVFDFKTNAWRLVEPSSPKRISSWNNPVYLNGLLYWLTEKEEFRSVLSFDLHTETFEIVCKAPISDMIIFNLDDNLCGSNRVGGGYVIWLWNLEEKTWNQIYFIDLQKICPFFENCLCEVTPLVTVEEMKKKLILCDYDCCNGVKKQVVLYDSPTTSYRVVSNRECTKTLCYFPSLISIL